MADRRPPGFNVDLGFYDSDEVLSIPRRIRAAAIGVWTLAGAYSANKLTDGYVSAEVLKSIGCTAAIRAALCATTPQPLWVDADTDPEIDRACDARGAQLLGINFTRWPKWQRTRAEVATYRAQEAERKRNARATQLQSSCKADAATSATHVQSSCNADEPHVQRNRNADAAQDNSSTSGDRELSGRTNNGRPHNVRPDDRNPRGRARARQTETKTETVSTSLTLVEGGPGGDPAVAAKAAPDARDKRGSRLPEDWRPSEATIAAMRDQFPHLDLKAIHTEFCDYWRAVPGAKGRKLDWDATWRNRVREIASRQPARNGHSPPATGISAGEAKVAGWAQLGNRNSSERKAIDQ